jgi:hypothetical protein
MRGRKERRIAEIAGRWTTRKNAEDTCGPTCKSGEGRRPPLFEVFDHPDISALWAETVEEQPLAVGRPDGIADADCPAPGLGVDADR